MCYLLQAINEDISNVMRLSSTSRNELFCFQTSAKKLSANYKKNTEGKIEEKFLKNERYQS
jgi:hypothetical protein